MVATRYWHRVCFDVPSEGYLGSRIDQNYAPADIHVKREALLNRLAQELGSFWKDTYLTLDPDLQKEFLWQWVYVR